jgi:adenylate cyclase class IV
MAVHFHPHARERLTERGVTQEEVEATVEEGEEFPARFGRTGFRRNFSFDKEWRRRYYRTKQVEVYAVREDDDWLVITVITRYF